MKDLLGLAVTCWKKCREKNRVMYCKALKQTRKLLLNCERLWLRACRSIRKFTITTRMERVIGWRFPSPQFIKKPGNSKVLLRCKLILPSASKQRQQSGKARVITAALSRRLRRVFGCLTPKASRLLLTVGWPKCWGILWRKCWGDRYLSLSTQNLGK